MFSVARLKALTVKKKRTEKNAEKLRITIGMEIGSRIYPNMLHLMHHLRY